MKKVFKKWILPICLLLMIFTQLIDYYLHKEINPALLVVVVVYTRIYLYISAHEKMCKPILLWV